MWEVLGAGKHAAKSFAGDLILMPQFPFSTIEKKYLLSIQSADKLNSIFLVKCLEGFREKVL